jgi:hypothetical protein
MFRPLQRSGLIVEARGEAGAACAGAEQSVDTRGEAAGRGAGALIYVNFRLMPGLLRRVGYTAICGV